eukprot:6212436-Pleurochrysis_carterae.AAC.1
MASPGVGEGSVVSFMLSNLTHGYDASPPFPPPIHIIEEKGNYYLTLKERVSFDLSLSLMRVLNKTLHEYDLKSTLTSSPLLRYIVGFIGFGPPEQTVSAAVSFGGPDRATTVIKKHIGKCLAGTCYDQVNPEFSYGKLTEKEKAPHVSAFKELFLVKSQPFTLWIRW